MLSVFLQGVPIFLLIFCRITAFFIVIPVFSARNVPSIFKIGLGLAVSFIIFSVHGSEQAIIPATPELILFIIREILIGLLLGFIVYLFFAVVQTAGAIMDMQIGFAMANVVDPNTGISAPLLGNFKYMVLTLYFLMLNGHHYLISGLMRSYEWIPLQNEFFAQLQQGNITQFLVLTFGNTFLIAMQLAAPLIVALFLTDVGLGFLTKSAPQFNIFVVGIPMKIIIGLFLLTLFIPVLTVLFEYLFSTMFEALEQIITIVQGT